MVRSYRSPEARSASTTRPQAVAAPRPEGPQSPPLLGTPALLGIQRAAGNSATVELLRRTGPDAPGRQAGSGASLQVQRLFGVGKKKPKQPQSPPISPFLAQAISSEIAKHPTMQQAEKLREEGKEDEALNLLEKFWDNENLLVKNEQGYSRLVKLSQFKALMFTPSERRMLKIRKWRAAVVVKDMWDTAVRKGEAHDPNPVKEETDSSATVDSVGGYIGDVGTANTIGKEGAKYGPEGVSEIGKVGGKVVTDIKDKLTKPKLPNLTTTTTTTTTTTGPSSGGGGMLSDVKTEVGNEWTKETDTHYITNSSDSNYEAQKYSGKSEWADGIMGIIGQSITLITSVVKTISLALDKKASKADVAAQIQDNLSQASATAGTISQAVENIKGSELTTNMFHWVPGLSIFSNGFEAISSMITLIQRACRIYKVNQERDKVTEKEKEDLALAMKRVWVRAAQQVEQDSFTVAKNLTNTGLAIAEVATAGGFGIPKLAQTVISVVSHVHSFGHAIADSVRAAATKSARNNYFGAKLSGSAEKLIRTDPLAAAEAIIGRAGEGDANALELLKAYGIKVPGLTAPKEVVTKIVGNGRGSGTVNTEHLLEYSPGDVVLYKAALDKLMNALAEKEQPQTMWDKVKGTVQGVLAKPGQMRDRYRQAKRIGEVRNEQDYGGKKDRGVGWALKQSVFGGESGVKKLYEKTTERINTAFNDHKSGGGVGPKGQKVFNVTDETARVQLLERIQPESLVRQKKEQAEMDKNRKPIEVFDPKLMETWNKAMAMSIGKLRGIVEGGMKQSGLSNDEWKVLLAAFVERFSQQAQQVQQTQQPQPVGGGTP